MKRLFGILIIYVSVLSAGWEYRYDEDFECEFEAGVAYEVPEEVSEECWASVQPYFLPVNDNLRVRLDRIFSASRVTADRKSLEAAGFELTPDQGLHVVVASHRDLKGYLVKVILDKYDPNTAGKGEDWQHWIKRIEGERVIRLAINDLGYKKYFKVPRQWIYPLPRGPKCPEKEGYYPKGFILIVEDMKLESKETNTQLYRKIGKKYLDAIYTITTKYGLSDCCNKHNLPWCKDGKMAFVDTETFHNWPINYHRLVEFLSTDKRTYWKKLREQGGPKKR